MSYKKYATTLVFLNMKKKQASSFGYHSDDGGLFCGNGISNLRFEPFTAGDVVGVGIDLGSCTFFLTKNGKSLWTNLKAPKYATLFPCLGIDSLDICEANFGEKPFLYDVTEKRIDSEVKMSDRERLVRNRMGTVFNKLLDLFSLGGNPSQAHFPVLGADGQEIRKEEFDLYFGHLQRRRGRGERSHVVFAFDEEQMDDEEEEEEEEYVEEEFKVHEFEELEFEESDQV